MLLNKRINGKYTFLSPAAWLNNTSIDKKIDVATLFELSLHERISVVYVYKFCISFIQFIIDVKCEETRKSWIKSCYSR